MRYLVHSEDATFNSANGRYEFNLVTRIPNPVRIRINQATYTAATASSYPQVVYLRSEKLSELTRSKHTVELKNNGHEDSTDVLCALQESHTIGRYHLNTNNTRRGVTFPVFGHIPIRKLDFYFTNNRTLMADSASSGNSGSGSGSGTTDADIIAIGSDLCAWIDLDPVRTLTSAFATCSGVGDLPHYLYSRAPSPATLVLDANYDFELYQMGTNSIGISRDSASAGGYGQYMSDTTDLPTWEQEFQVHHIVKMSSSYNDTTGFFKLGSNICRVQTNSSGGVKFIDSSGAYVVLSNITWIPSRTYVLSIQRKQNTTTSNYEFLWRWEDLDGSTTVTETTDAGSAVTSTQGAWGIGVSGIYFRHIAGPLIAMNGLDQTQYNNAISWLKLWYDGTDTSSSSGNSTSSSVDATFFMELDIKAQNK